MTTKALLVLIGLALLAMMLRKQFLPPVKPKGPKIEAARKCPTCGAYVMAGAACPRPECQGD